MLPTGSTHSKHTLMRTRKQMPQCQITSFSQSHVYSKQWSWSYHTTGNNWNLVFFLHIYTSNSLCVSSLSLIRIIHIGCMLILRARITWVIHTYQVYLFLTYCKSAVFADVSGNRLVKKLWVGWRERRTHTHSLPLCPLSLQKKLSMHCGQN